MSNLPLQQKVNEYVKRNNIENKKASVNESTSPQQDFSEIKEKMPIEQKQFLESMAKIATFLQVKAFFLENIKNFASRNMKSIKY